MEINFRRCSHLPSLSLSPFPEEKKGQKNNFKPRLLDNVIARHKIIQI